MTEKANKSNDNKQITDLVPESELDNIFTSLTKGQKNKKLMTFYLYWLFGFPIKTCAETSGYSESYGYNLVQKYREQPNVRHRVDEILNMFPERYKSVCKLRLPQIAEVEAKALDEYAENPRLAIDKPQLLKHLKQSASVLDADVQYQGPTTIQVANIQQLMLQFHEGAKSLDGNGQLIEVEPDE